MNKGKQNKPLQVSLHGMDGRSYNTMVKFLQGPCKGVAVVVEKLNAEVDIVDADLSNSKKILEERLANQPLRPIIILSLQEINLDNTIFVRKPIQTDAMMDSFSVAKNMLLGKAEENESKTASRQVKRIKKQAFDTSEQSQSEQNKLTQPSDNSDEQSKSSKHRTAMLLDEKNFSAFIGLLPGIDFNDPEQVPLASYNPKDHFQGYIQSAIKVARNKGQVLKLNSGWKPIIMFPKSHEIWVDAEDKQLRAYASLTFLTEKGKEHKKMTLSPVHPRDESMNLEMEKFQDLDSFLWKLACWTSKGRYPYTIDYNRPVVLKRWPNFTRLMITPHALRISALLINGPRTLANIAESLNIKPQYVFVFFSAAYALGLADQAKRKSDEMLQPEKITPNKSKGLLNRIISKLRSNKS